jgi:hypothetical protein
MKVNTRALEVSSATGYCGYKLRELDHLLFGVCHAAPSFLLLGAHSFLSVFGTANSPWGCPGRLFGGHR